MAKYCIGTAQFGMPYGIANRNGQPNLDEIISILNFALSKKIRYFDTAQSYGNCEALIGRALRNIPNSHNIKIISKLSPSLENNNSKRILKSVEDSLKKLGIKTLYGFLAHSKNDIDSETFFETMKKLKSEGLIQKSGISIYSPREALNLITHPGIDMIQMPLNILDRRWIDEGIFEKAKENNTQLFFRSIFLQGLIFLNEEELVQKSMSWAKPHLHKFNKLVNETNYTKLELTLGILSEMSKENVIIMGFDTLEQFKENWNIINSSSLIDNKTVRDWWEKLPFFPNRLLNPSKW